MSKTTIPISFYRQKVYHLVWAKKKGMCWRLVDFDEEKNIAYMETPSTKKRLVTKLSDLRNTERNSEL